MKIYVGNATTGAAKWIDLDDYASAVEFCAAGGVDDDVNYLDFEDIHSSFCRTYADIEAIYEYKDLCDNNPAAAIDAGLDCDIPLDSIIDAYAGNYDSDADFAENMADECGLLDAMHKISPWLTYAIDWSHAGRELMFDYTESNNHYFRSNY